MDILFWGPLVRVGQAIIASFPTLIVGWLIAAVFERILGRQGTFQLFGGRTWRQLPQAWLLGMLLPVCSLGVIPVMRQMRKSGISGGTILAFGLTAPLFNPISVLYGLTLSDPIAIMVFCLCSLTIVTVMGVLWDWWFPNSWQEMEPLPATPYGLRRIGAVLLSMCKQAWSGSTVYIGIAYLGAGILAALLPAGILQHAAAHDNLAAPLTMAAVATLAYVTPMAAIVQVASMFEHGNSIGAAFTLLVLGTGVNLGMIVWIFREYGRRKAFVWICCLFLVVLGLGYCVDGPLFPDGVQPADHTHAFDSYCNPFHWGTSHLPAASGSLLLNTASGSAAEMVAGGFCLLFFFMGALLARLDPNDRWMEWIHAERPSSTSDLGRFDIVLPNWVIAMTSLVGLVLASIGGCFLYYPPRSEIHKEMILINTELQSAALVGDWKVMEHWIPIQEDWAHKLSVSGYLRREPMSRYQQMRLKVFLSKLELLEHAGEDQDAAEAKDFGQQMGHAHRRLFAAFRVPNSK